MSNDFRIYYNVPELGRALQQIGAYNGAARMRIEKAVKDSTFEVKKGAKQRVRRRTGKLAETISASFNARNVQGTIKAGSYIGSARGGAPYAHLVEFGTRPHTIRAQKGKYMEVEGKLVKEVHHPGAKEHPFMRPAYQNEEPKLIENIKKAVRNVN